MALTIQATKMVAETTTVNMVLPWPEFEDEADAVAEVEKVAEAEAAVYAPTAGLRPARIDVADHIVNGFVKVTVVYQRALSHAVL